MAARIKKIFHRKRDDGSEPSLAEDHGSEVANTDSSLRTSLYDSTIPREPPQTGTHPLKGNSTILSPNHISPTSASGPSLPSPRSPQFDSVEVSAISSSERDQQRLSGGMGQKGTARLPERSDERQRKLPEIPVSPLSSSLNLDNEVCQFPPGAPDSVINSGKAMRSSMEASQSRAGSKDGEARRPNRDEISKEVGSLSNDRHQLNSIEQAIDHPPKYTQYSSLANYKPSSGSSPKEPASRMRTPPSDHPSSSIVSSPYEPQSPIPSATGGKEAQHGAKAKATSFSQPIGKTPERVDTAEKILEKAQSNSARTDITETIAPAVVHETIRREVHEIRQEVITREIHNHDYYHRILPIVDVEVLPARHFLPVEGGGLVEISRDEVPGRGRQWIIAETASRIRSDQPAPQAISRFSAREFTGSEGESRRYITPEGFERTEETLVHPPELETGGRDTGQTWPLELGGEVDPNIHNSLGSPSGRQSKKPPINRPVAAERQ